jgi:acyl carrier protein
MVDGNGRRDELLGVLQGLGFQSAELTEQARFREDLAIDSTELVEISVAVERTMLVSIDSTALWSLKTVGDLMELVDSSSAVSS